MDDRVVLEVGVLVHVILHLLATHRGGLGDRVIFDVDVLVHVMLHLFATHRGVLVDMLHIREVDDRVLLDFVLVRMLGEGLVDQVAAMAARELVHMLVERVSACWPPSGDLMSIPWWVSSCWPPPEAVLGLALIAGHLEASL